MCARLIVESTPTGRQPRPGPERPLEVGGLQTRGKVTGKRNRIRLGRELD